MSFLLHQKDGRVHPFSIPPLRSLTASQGAFSLPPLPLACSLRISIYIWISVKLPLRQCLFIKLLYKYDHISSAWVANHTCLYWREKNVRVFHNPVKSIRRYFSFWCNIIHSDNKPCDNPVLASVVLPDTGLFNLNMAQRTHNRQHSSSKQKQGTKRSSRDVWHEPPTPGLRGVTGPPAVQRRIPDPGEREIPTSGFLGLHV